MKNIKGKNEYKKEISYMIEKYIELNEEIA